MKSWLKSPVFWGVVGLTAIGCFIRFWRLDVPNDYVFDEVYYAKWAVDYLHHVSFFDVHPPLGKLLIAVGIKLVNNTSFGWRWVEALVGSFIVPLTYAVAYQLFAPQLSNYQGNAGSFHEASGKRTGNEFVAPSPNLIALFAAYFVLIDGLILVQTRTALLDSFLVTFSLAAYASFLWYGRSQTTRQAVVRLLLTGLWLGLALATKWTAVAAFGLIIVWWFWHRRELPRVTPILSFLSLFVIPAALYVSSFIFNGRTTDFWSYLIDWHKQAWHFHHTLTASHPYQSRWWSWLYLARPVWYYYKEDHGLVRGIIALGNPILWWASLPALLASFWLILRRKVPTLVVPFLAFLAAYLPWSVISRTEFQYYVVPGVPFMFILLAWWLVRWLEKPLNASLSYLVILLGTIAFIFFFPILTAYPISSNYYHLHSWFRSWI